MNMLKGMDKIFCPKCGKLTGEFDICGSFTYCPHCDYAIPLCWSIDRTEMFNIVFDGGDYYGKKKVNTFEHVRADSFEEWDRINNLNLIDWYKAEIDEARKAGKEIPNKMKALKKEETDKLLKTIKDCQIELVKCKSKIIP